MAQQQQQGGSGGGDNSTAPIWIMVLVFVTFAIIWYTSRRYIVTTLFKFNLLQAQLISLFISNPKLEKGVYLMQTLDPSTVTWNQLMELTGVVGDYMRYPIGVILILLGIWLYQSNITIKLKRSHSMNTLRAQEQVNWPAIMPIIKSDIVAQDVNSGPWAMALTPLEFAKKHNLLRKDDAILDSPVPGTEMTAGIRRGDAKRIFTMQLGPYWEGFDRCSPQAMALAGVFMARMNRDGAGAKMILETLDKTFAAGKPDFSVARAIVKKYQDTELVQEIIPKHAYVLTVLPSLLQAARLDGVVPSAEFLWLKPIDRRLWYTLNSVGRQTPFAEVAGVFSHWKAEIALGRRSLVPMIDEAIKALEIAIKEVKLTSKVLQELKL